MSRSPKRLAVLLLAASLATGAWADPDSATAPIDDVIAPVDDVIAEIDSLDGAETESTKGDEVTVALTSDVLFALNKWVLTPKAKLRLKGVAEKVKTSGAVRIEGHTDDQGADAYNQSLSQRRAQAVQQELVALLPSLTFEAKGFGETKPKVPNVVDGSPDEKNRAKNRRVEIIFTADQ